MHAINNEQIVEVWTNGGAVNDEYRFVEEKEKTVRFLWKKTTLTIPAHWEYYHRWTDKWVAVDKSTLDEWIEADDEFIDGKEIRRKYFTKVSLTNGEVLRFKFTDHESAVRKAIEFKKKIKHVTEI